MLADLLRRADTLPRVVLTRPSVVVESAGMNRKYLLRTLGCKVNQYESQQIRELIESHGWRPARPSEVADLAVINGCAVTTSAAAKTRQAVRRAAAGGSVPVVVIGCAAAADAERLRSIPGVVALVKHTDQVAKHLHHYLVHNQHGNLALPSGKTCADASATDGPACLSTFEPDCKGAVAITPVTPAEPPGFLAAHRYPDGSIPACGEDVNAADQPNDQPNDHLPPITRFDNRTRAFLKVQDGCDAFCSFCIVPRLRPQLHFKPVEAAVAEATALVAAGHKEIVLSGIYLGAYGRPTARRNRFEADGRSPLAELVAAIAAVPGLQRLRLSSLEPGDLDDALLDVLASHACCVPHLHLPLQSGSSQILKRMNRQYDADDFTTMIDRVANRLYQPAITTDVVVGFPGETDEDFEADLGDRSVRGLLQDPRLPVQPPPRHHRG